MDGEVGEGAEGLKGGGGRGLLKGVYSVNYERGPDGYGERRGAINLLDRDIHILPIIFNYIKI